MIEISLNVIYLYEQFITVDPVEVGVTGRAFFFSLINTHILFLRSSSLLKKKKLLIIYSPLCHPRWPCLSFFSRKEIQVFDENIPAFFSI